MVLKKYRFPIIMTISMVILYLINHELGKKAAEITSNSILEMVSILPPVFILLGLLDVWIPKETMIKFLGEHSGILGVVISFIMGSAAAGPLYGAFPIAAVLMKKGAKFSNVLIFIGAWSTTKIPMFMFEITSLGPRFAITRLVVDIIGIMIIAYVIQKLVSKEEVKAIYDKAETM
ncbi:permease [Acidaminobacter sp. JC074]|uniref:permease n=1 Tax=Acidaminobacter sp. JC074 TaxID=2530199 RepID=UPI001F10C5DF|nr:permease [Acidaminobacter sp. JC074]MCH4888142.1 permease [Acidaminobacter sp. JC074]